MNVEQQVFEAVRAECQHDYEGLWGIPWELREVHGVTDPVARKAISLIVVQMLLKADGIGVGQFNGSTFEFWDSSPHESLSRISSEWEALGREPSLGEIAWFTAKA